MIALVRAVSSRLRDCELTHLTRRPIDAGRAQGEHDRYTAMLRDFGVRIELLPSMEESPDGVFVEDTAVVLDEVAIMARSAVCSRWLESATVAGALRRYRPVAELSAGERLDGGDVMRIGRVLYVGQSGRTNELGITRLRHIAQPFGYEVHPVAMGGCLHLKTACTFIPPDIVVVNPDWIAPEIFGAFRVILVEDGEPFAANTLTVNGVTLVSSVAPKTERKLNSAGITTRVVEIPELQKAEAGLTCLSILFV